MEVLRKISVYLWVGVAIAAMYLGWVMLSRRSGTVARDAGRNSGDASREAEFARTYGGKDVRILQFYARDGSVTEGNKSAICYGVVNAKSVRLEPASGAVWPSVNKCLEIEPKRDTRYTLTAEGNDGLIVSESFVLGVKPDTETLPRISAFEIVDKKADYDGKPVFLVSFSQQNGLEVSIDPPMFSTLQGSPNGRFYVKPAKTTTYTLTVTGKFGHRVQRQLTLEVPRS